MEDAVAKVVSLLEGAVTLERARAALEASGGSVDGAVCHIFGDQAPGASSVSGDIVVDLEDSEGPSPAGASSSQAPREPREGGEASAPGVPPAEGPASDAPSPLTKRGRQKGAGGQATPKSEARKKRAKVKHEPVVEIPRGESPPAERPLTKVIKTLMTKGRQVLGLGQSHKSKPPPRESSVQSVEANTWNVLDSSFLDKEWLKTLHRDPPCLTLRGQHPDDAQAASDGLLHMGQESDSGRVSYGEAWCVRKAGKYQVETQRLQRLFKKLIEKVRYAPSTVELTWRVLNQDATARGTAGIVPPDLRGDLPRRPFKLLDNDGDVPAEQPPHFEEHHLRPEQLRSLSWMQAREREPGSLEETEAEQELEAFVVEWRRFWVPGGAAQTEEQQCEQIVVGARIRLVTNAGLEAEPGKRSRVSAGSEGLVVEVHPAGRKARITFPNHSGSFLASFEDLEFVDTGEIAPGCHVKVLSTVKAPQFGWGGVKHEMIGVMLRQDGDVMLVKFPTHDRWKGKATELTRAYPFDDSKNEKPCVLDLRVRADYSVKGGILADQIGYGKTATTIALIDSTLERPSPPIPEIDNGRFFPAKGTLIIVPSNLFDQWLSEISKFVWNGKNLRTNLKMGWSPKTCPIKIFAMPTVVNLTKVKAAELAEADVVLCSYRLLYSEIYVERTKELGGSGFSGLAGLAEETSKLIAGLKSVRSGRKGDLETSNWEELQFPVLEQFHWRRIVFDEFHELESFESRQQNSLQHLRSSYRWGLTGTPPCDTNAGAIFMASLFRIDLTSYLVSSDIQMQAGYPNLAAWEGDLLATELCSRFLDVYARQNTAELPHIKLQEHVVVVHHTPAERALYLGQAHEAPDVNSPEAFSSQDSIKALEKLLKLCSHFQAGGGEVSSNAKEECVRIGEQKERRVLKARNQLVRCSRVIAMLQRKLTALKVKKLPAVATTWRSPLDAEQAKMKGEGVTASNVLEELALEEKAAGEENIIALIETLRPHKPRDEELKSRIIGPDRIQDYGESWTDLWALALEAKVLGSLLAGQAQEQAQNIRELYEAVSAGDFFKRTLQVLAQDDSPEARTCTVCLEENLALDKIAITPCAHSFCIDCLKATIEKFGHCSICRRNLSNADVRPVVAELAPPPEPPPPAVASASSSSGDSVAASSSSAESRGRHFDTYGTKLAVVVQKLLELRRQDPTAKVILFTQFDDLKRKVAAALLEFGVSCTMLQGAVSQRAAIIRDWQHNPASGTFVLLLSLEQSASGTNLTAASHVVFLHPMLAATSEKSVGYEMQAIGRARRHGQLRDTVHVWRFVTAGTIEQKITEKHQAALWASEEARQARHQAGNAAAGAVDVPDAVPEGP